MQSKNRVSKNHIFVDKISGTTPKRPNVDKCLAQLKAGHRLIVWRLPDKKIYPSLLITLIEILRKTALKSQVSKNAYLLFDL